MGKKEVIDMFFEFLQQQMKERADICPDSISYSKVRWVLSRFGIPKWLQMPFIKIMIDDGLLQRTSKRELRLITRNGQSLKVEEEYNKEITQEVYRLV